MGQCFAIIAPDEIGALEFLGTYKKSLTPGCHCFLPGSTVRTKSTRITQNDVQIETKTQDNVFVQIKISVQQEIFREKAYEAMYKLTNPHDQIDAYVADVVRGHVPSMTLDGLFAAKVEIATEVKEKLTAAMQDYGFHILQVLVVDIEPDRKVKEAMNQINESRRLRMAAEEQAEADKIILVKKAEAEKALAIMKAEADAEAKFLQGQGVARSRQAILAGMKESITGTGQEGAITTADLKELLLISQYLDTLEKMSQSTATTIFMPHGLHSVAELQEQVRRGTLEAAAASR